MSLAAAKAVLTKLRQEPVIATLKAQGQKIIDSVNRIISDNELEQVLNISGHPTWSFLLFKDFSPYSAWEIKTLFMQEMFERGVYTIGTHNLSYAHNDSDVETLLRSYGEVFQLIKGSTGNGTLKEHLKCEPLVPLFKVR